MPDARALLADAAARLRAAGVPSPEVDAELLLAHVTGRSRALVRLSGDVDVDQQREFDALVEQRAARIPLQHLTGTAAFRHLELEVGPGVFVPRPETELVVDLALRHLTRTAALLSDPEEGARGPVLVDLCTGSGALALALATEVPRSTVFAAELSGDAVGWARRNVARYADAVEAVGSALDVILGDATTCAEAGGPLEAQRGFAEVVVTNPPYVPDDAIPREPEVRDHDPALALYGGADGLDVIRPLARQAALLLRRGGLLLIEHADVQGEDAGDAGVPAVLRAQPDPLDPTGPAWRGVIDHCDLAGRPRTTSAFRC